MIKFLLSVLLATFALPTWAHGPYRGGGYHHYRGSNWGWVAPAIIGGAIVYSATRPVYAYPPPLPPVVVYPNTLPPAPFGYHYEQVLDAGCNCYRQVLLPN